ncbi:MAG: YidC/Oxa1 family membrane protein insertase [Lachnospiraceae bacterium]|nr:YidC/Oxa1 family membrane protein insertase [Lachnospiraceae bacterium]
MNFLALTKYDGAIIGPVARLLGHIMEAIFSFTGLFGIFNIGLSIIIFTIVIKALMIPMSIKQQKFTKMNAIISPEIQMINKRYAGKKDQASMMKRNEETMAVYNKYGVRPTGGCLQLIIQFPILLALYRVVWNIPAYVGRMRDIYYNIISVLSEKFSGFMNKEAFTDLLKAQATAISPEKISKITETFADASASAEAMTTAKNYLVDAMYAFDGNEWLAFKDTFDNIGSMAVQGGETVAESIDKIESMNSFMGLNLSVSPMSYVSNFKTVGLWIVIAAIMIPVLSGVIQYISTKISMAAQERQKASTKKSADEDNAFVQSMNMMVKIMPVISIAFCFMFPTCIGVYWIISSLIQVVIQICVNRYMDKLDINDVVAKNMEKINAKRARMGLAPQKVTKVSNITQQIEEDQAEMEEKARKREEQIKASTEYYRSTTGTGRLSSKANMVAQYNERNKNKK